MKTRILKLYGRWVVEFPFGAVVYCDTWEQARDAFICFDYLLATHL